MYYFLKKSNFDLENSDIKIEITKKLTKKEKEVLKKLQKKYEKDSQYTKLNLKVFDDNFKEIIKELSKKIISVCIYKKGKIVSEFFTNIFDLCVFENDMLIYQFSTAIKETFTVGNIFSRLSILEFLMLDSEYTKEIFKILIKENKAKGEVEFELNELKKIFGIGEHEYQRYYDFERKVLRKILKELNAEDSYISFEKIKDNSNLNSKIKGVKLKYRIIYYVELERDTNKLLKEFASNIENFKEAYVIIAQLIKEKGFDETRVYIEKNKKELFSQGKDEASFNGQEA